MQRTNVRALLLRCRSWPHSCHEIRLSATAIRLRWRTAPSASRMTRILLVALSVAATDRRAQREPPWRQKFKLPPLRAERRRHLALVWENYGTRPTRYSRHPGDVPVGLDPQLSMSKKNNGRNPAVNTADRVVAVQDALAELLVRLRRKELHCYNFIGNNNDSLMNVLGCSPIMCGVVMCTAGILGLKKKKHEEDCDVFFVRTDNQNGWDEMVSRHCLADDVQRTPCKKSMFVRLGSVNPRAADALHDDGWMAFDMVTRSSNNFASKHRRRGSI